MKKIGLAVIGAGQMGRIHISNICRYLKDEAELLYIVDAMPDGVNTWLEQQEFEAPKAITDMDVAMDDPKVDAILIASPAWVHGDITLKAISKGKHVLCEKPMDYDLEKCLKVVEEAKKANVNVQVGFHRRYDHDFAAAQKMIKEGKFGKLFVSKLTSRDPRNPAPVDKEKLRKIFGVAFRGVIFDSAIHDFDVARFVSACEPESVYCMGGSLGNELGDNPAWADTIVTNIKFKDGSMVVVENGATPYGYDQRAEFMGRDGNIHVNNDFPTTNYWIDADGYHSGKPLYFIGERYIQAYTDELRSFCKAIREGKETEVTAVDGLISTVIALAAEKSLAENRVVKISEIYDGEYIK